MISKVFSYRVNYSETDQMGFVHHSNYAKFYENARIACLNELGIAYSSIEDAGILMPVIKVISEFKKPLRFDECYKVEITIDKMPASRLKTNYKIYNSENEVIHSARVDLAFIQKETNKACRPPIELISVFSKFLY